MTSVLLGALREQTAPTHQLVERQLDLLDPQLTTERIAYVIERLYGFWAGTEPIIDQWSSIDPDAAELTRWSRRRRSGLFAEDLHRLGRTTADVASIELAQPVFATAQPADVLGWLYVTEGSTLGGAIIDRHIRRLTIETRPTLRSFTPYAEGPGPMWRAYLTGADGWVGDDPERTAAVVAAAVMTFSTLQRWTLQPAPLG